MTAQASPYVHTELSEGLQRIEFFHPSHNSLPGDLLKEIKEAIEQAGENPDVKLIELRSGGARTFCAGASFDELVAIDNEVRGKEFFMGFATVINAIRKCPKIVIGRIQGKAVGGGVGLASAVDYCVATKFASIRLSELAVGIGPFVIGPAVERKVGLSAFSQMSITPNTWQTAEWAKTKGLYAEVFESTESMDEYLGTFIKELLSMNPEAISLLKRVFWKGTEDWDNLLESRAEMSGKLVLSKFSKDSISKFLNR